MRLFGACDDFVHVFVNNTRVFDSRNPPTGFSYSTTVSLPAGDVRLALIFVDGGGFQDFSLRSQVFEQPGIVYREKPTSAP